MTDYTFFAAGRVSTTPLDLDSNSKKIIELCNKAKNKGVRFVAFPELSLSGYSCGDMFEHPELLKACTNAVLKLKYEIPEGIAAGIGLPLLGSNGKVIDAYLLIEKGNIIGIAAPHSFYNAKDSRVRNFTTPFADDVLYRIGITDYRVNNNFEIFDKKISIVFNDGDIPFILDDSELIVCPEVSRYELGSELERISKFQVLSAAYKCPVISTNLLGCESGADIYDGLSVVADNGKLIALSDSLSFVRSDLFTAENGVSEFLCEYDSIVRAVALGLFDWMCKTYAHGFALSMSGGADSALCATCVCYGQLAALSDLGYEEYKRVMEKLGFEVPPFNGDIQTFIKEKMMPQVLTTVYQGSSVSGDITRTAAAKVSEDLGACHYEWSISNLVDEYTRLINGTTPGDPLSWEKNDLTLQNIQARCRAPSIWMIANRYNKLLITTCNASEEAVGYCTMDGDTAGGVAPIGDISKSRVLKINQHIADDGLEVVKGKLKLECGNMSYVSAQAPTAELRPGGNQTDERDLMPYVILDRIHVLHQNELKTPENILEILTEEFSAFDRETLLGFVRKYFRKLAQNQWKRERGATTFHIEKSDLNAKNGFVFPLLNDGFNSILQNVK